MAGAALDAMLRSSVLSSMARRGFGMIETVAELPARLFKFA